MRIALQAVLNKINKEKKGVKEHPLLNRIHIDCSVKVPDPTWPQCDRPCIAVATKGVAIQANWTQQ